MVAVRRVCDRSELRQFVDLPVGLYRGDPAFVPPDRGDDTRALRRLDGASLLLARGRRSVVGRVAAFVDDRVGGCFGWLDWNGDSAVLEELVDAAAAALADDGCTTMTGPLRWPFHDTPGILVEGGDHRPPFGGAWNPPDRAPQLLSLPGMEPVCELTAGTMDLATLAADPVPGARVAFEDALAAADALAGAPRTAAERDVLVRAVRPFADPALVYSDATSAAVAVPDVNELMIRLGGSLGPRATVAFLRAARERRWRTAVVIAAGGDGRAIDAVAAAAAAGGYQQLIVPAAAPSFCEWAPAPRAGLHSQNGEPGHDLFGWRVSRVCRRSVGN